MTRVTFGEVKWGRLPGGAVAHAFDTGEESETSLCGRAGIDRWRAEGAELLARCRRCLLVSAPSRPFMVTEDELSDEARAILAHARGRGEPFTRAELIEVAPGSQWDIYSRYPKTIARLDPIRELVTAGMVVELDEVPLKSNPDRSYKRWALADRVGTLDELLDTFAEAVRSGNGATDVRAEIIRRFGRG